MDFDLSDEQRLIRETARAFTDRVKLHLAGARVVVADGSKCWGRDLLSDLARVRTF